MFGLLPNTYLSEANFEKLPPSFTSLIYYNPKSGSLERVDNSSGQAFLGTYDMSQGLDNDIWLIDRNGIFRLDKNMKLEWISEISGNTTEHANVSLKTDSEGNVWILSWPASLKVYNPKTRNVRSFSLDEIVKEHPLTGQNHYMEFDREGNLWITWDKGILHFNCQIEMFTYSDLLERTVDPGFSVTTLCFDDFENLWIGTSDGLYKYYDRPSFKIWGYSDSDISGLANGWASKFTEDSNGLVWISTTVDGYRNNVTGITLFNPDTKTFSSFLNTELIPGVEIDILIV